MNISKELFDKMLRAAILKDRINYVAGLMYDLQIQKPVYVQAAIAEFKRKVCQGLREQLNSLGVEPLSYEDLLKEEILSAQSRTILMSGTDYDWNAIWEQRRYEIAAASYLLHIKQGLEKPVYVPNVNKIYAQLAIKDADYFIKELKEQ